MSARYSKIACLIACALFSVSAFASPLTVSVYSGTTAQSPIKQGAKSITFDLKGFSGTIGNATFSSETVVIPVRADQDGDRLNDIVYTVTGGTMIIVDVR